MNPYIILGALVVLFLISVFGPVLFKLFIYHQIESVTRGELALRKYQAELQAKLDKYPVTAKFYTDTEHMYITQIFNDYNKTVSELSKLAHKKEKLYKRIRN